ncbi:MAG: IS200/IS605 family transposase [Pirellulales bacterium]|nr:IS200/IS605 family transposase [Pirellulales bacterium]
MPQSLASLHVHFVFSTKNREPRLETEFRPRLFEYIGGTLRECNCVLVAAGGTADHLHLLVSLARTTSVADVMRIVKANSSKWIHQVDARLGDFQWQTGYGAFAVSFSAIDAVRSYLANQDVHHAKQSFQDEFRELLRRHEVEWDERYVWD